MLNLVLNTLPKHSTITPCHYHELDKTNPQAISLDISLHCPTLALAFN